MRTRAVIPALALAGALVATVGASARPQATNIQIRTVMNAAQEVPSPTGAVSDARGTFSATVTKSETGASVSWQMSFNGLTANAIAAHIHTGAVGSAGPVVLALCGPCKPGERDRRTDPGCTRRHPGGHRLCQRATHDEPRARFAASWRRPRHLDDPFVAAGGPEAEGQRQACDRQLHGDAREARETGTVAWRLRFSKLTGREIAAHIHVGRVGRAGPVAVALCGPCRNGQRGTANLTAATLAALQGDAAT